MLAGYHVGVSNNGVASSSLGMTDVIDLHKGGGFDLTSPWLLRQSAHAQLPAIHSRQHFNSKSTALVSAYSNGGHCSCRDRRTGPEAPPPGAASGNDT